MHSAVRRESGPSRRGTRRMHENKNKTEHELLAETLGRIVERLAACRAAAAQASGVDAFATAAAEHLAQFDPGELPLAAQTIWADRVARPLRADPTQPLPEQNIAALRSWPTARLRQLVRALGEIEHIARETEIDARNEIIRATISREYS